MVQSDNGVNENYCSLIFGFLKLFENIQNKKIFVSVAVDDFNSLNEAVI